MRALPPQEYIIEYRLERFSKDDQHWERVEFLGYDKNRAIKEVLHLKECQSKHPEVYTPYRLNTLTYKLFSNVSSEVGEMIEDGGEGI